MNKYIKVLYVENLLISMLKALGPIHSSQFIPKRNFVRIMKIGRLFYIAKEQLN